MRKETKTRSDYSVLFMQMASIPIPETIDIFTYKHG